MPEFANKPNSTLVLSTACPYCQAPKGAPCAVRAYAIKGKPFAPYTMYYPPQVHTQRRRIYDHIKGHHNCGCAPQGAR